MESFYPPNVHWYTSFYIGKISKSLTNEFNLVNDEILWNPISQIGKIIAFTTNMYFYPKNVLVSMITGVWKSKNSNIFILNSVNGGQSFLSKTNYDFFYSKLHPTVPLKKLFFFHYKKYTTPGPGMQCWVLHMGLYDDSTMWYNNVIITLIINLNTTKD